MPYETLLLDRDASVAIVSLNRPKALNALNRQLLEELDDVIASVGADPSIRATAGQSVFERLETLGKPTIAAVNGFALGGGCELAMACTLRVAADSAQFGQPEIDLGLLPGFGGTQRLTRLVGRGRALDLLLRGHRIGAVEAERIGLVNLVVPAASLLERARQIASELAAKAPVALRYILAAVHEGADLPLDAANRIEAAYFGLAAATEDMREGTRAFLEKRKPAFGGR